MVDSVNMMLSLLPHCAARFKEILDEIPTPQRRISVDKWCKVLEELRSMALALPEARGLFSHMQEALCHMKDKLISLTRSIHEALEDFCWMNEDLQSSQRASTNWCRSLLQSTAIMMHRA